MNKTQLYIDTASTQLKVRNKCFHIYNTTHNQIISPKRKSSIAILSNATINASAIKLAALNDIPIYYYSPTGKLIAQLRSSFFLKHVSLRHKQLLFMKSNQGVLWAISILQLKTRLQIETLKRYKPEKTKLEVYTVYIDSLKEKINTFSNLDLNSNKINNSIMGVEGTLASTYFKALNLIIPMPYRFKKRTRRPGLDYFNTTLNYVYGLTYSHIGKAIHASGLDSFCGALHTTPYKESLVYDAIEIFRPIIDRFVIKLCVDDSLNEKHFIPKETGFWLSRDGKKLIIPLYNDYLYTRIKIDYNVTSIKNHMYKQSQRLKALILNSQDVPDNL